MKIVLDTNVLVSGFLWKGNESKIIIKCIEGKLKNYTSLDILEEFERVLAYEKFQLTSREIEGLISKVIFFSIIIIPEIKVHIIKEDLTDNIFLECALAGSVNYIVSGDNHLLKLKDFKNMKIVKAKELLKIIGE